MCPESRATLIDSPLGDVKSADVTPPALLISLLNIAQSAGEQIMPYWQHKALGVELKADQSPVTQADLAAHETITTGLSLLTPNIPVLSEEQVPTNQARQQWQSLWLVDPLDGTREFIDGTPEFTVNIALIQDGRPQLGVISVPAQKIAYLFEQGKGAWRVEYGQSPVVWQRINLIKPKSKKTLLMTIAVSRRISADEQIKYDEFYQQLKQQGYQLTLLSAGSAYKFCLMADGKVDLYPRFHPTYEWDTAAGQGLLETLGGSLQTLKTQQPFRYNQRATLKNEGFIAAMPAQK